VIKEIVLNVVVVVFLALLMGGERHLGHNRCGKKVDHVHHTREDSATREPAQTLAHP
jgi:hypothetical protein